MTSMAEPGEQPSGVTIWLVEGVPPGTPADDVATLGGIEDETAAEKREREAIIRAV